MAVISIILRSNIPFVRLDGTLNLQQREKVIKQFSEESNILVSLLDWERGIIGQWWQWGSYFLNNSGLIIVVVLLLLNRCC